MTETKLALEPLRKEDISELLYAAGPCITMLLPPYRPGESREAAEAFLRTNLPAAAKKLAARRVSEALITELLEPLRQLSHDKELAAGSNSARVLFRSPGIFSRFELPVPPSLTRACTVGGCFWIRPMLGPLELPSNIYVLEVTKKAVALLACGLTSVAQVALPAGTPQTLDAFLGFDAPDHDLMNRSAAGPSMGAMHGVQFGTGAGRETEHAHLHDFYRAADRGVSGVLRSTGAPLVLAGVDEDVAIYRSVSACPNLLEESIHGSPSGAMTTAQILRNAHDIAFFDCQRRAAFKMAESKERLAPARYSNNLSEILRAAVEGRVSDLYLDENAEQMGDFDGKLFGGRTSWNDEDLLNVAAIETLRRSGVVFSLPSHLMTSPAAAAFRFSRTQP